MQSFLIVSKNKQKALDEANSLISKRKIGKLDVLILEFEKMLGVEDVRKFKEKIYLRPFESPEKTVIIDLFVGATTEAQNAMLKILEEPPSQTIFILISDSVNNFLPTIISRCQVIEIATKQTSNDGIEKEIDEILKGKIGDRLYFAQKISADKNFAVEWLESATLKLREMMLSDLENHNYSKMVKDFQEAYLTVKNTNANPRLTIENLFLNL